MTVTTFLSNKLNTATQAAAGGDQMKMMQWMMNLMPIMFFFIFNNYASGLTYYYFLSTPHLDHPDVRHPRHGGRRKLLAQLRAKGNAREKNPKKKKLLHGTPRKAQREQPESHAATAEEQKEVTPG